MSFYLPRHTGSLALGTRVAKKQAKFGLFFETVLRDLIFPHILREEDGGRKGHPFIKNEQTKVCSGPKKGGESNGAGMKQKKMKICEENPTLWLKKRKNLKTTKT